MYQKANRGLKWACVACLLASLPWVVAPVRAESTIELPAGTDAGTLGLAGRSLERVQHALKDLPDGYVVEVSFEIRSRAVTGYDEDMRYVNRTTMLDAEGRRDGEERIYANWYQPAMRISLYRAGERDGMERIYDTSGQRLEVETPWLNGVIQGVRRSFHPDGSVQTVTPFVDGVIEGESRTFDPEGNLLRIAPFRAGRRHGDSIDYWPEGDDQVQRIIPYRDGQVHGVAKAFYLDGTKRWVRPFHENSLHGVERHFDGEGVEMRTIYWFEDERVTRDQWEQADHADR